MALQSSNRNDYGSSFMGWVGLHCLSAVLKESDYYDNVFCEWRILDPLHGHYDDGLAPGSLVCNSIIESHPVIVVSSWIHSLVVFIQNVKYGTDWNDSKRFSNLSILFI